MNALLNPPDLQCIADFASSSWSESQRRRVLRPHWEDRSEITHLEEIKLREQCGRAMQWLLTLELACSTEYLGLKDTKKRLTCDMHKLLALPAVARFIDDYDYVGVRFLASRLGVALCGLPDLPAPRPAPAAPDVIEMFLNTEIALRADAGVQAFLTVLEDFSKPLPVPHDRSDEVGACRFRLWLRGKNTQLGQPAQEYGQGLARGAIRWCLDKAQLYKGRDLLIQTRFAVFDFYWLMKLFGAEVTTSGLVTYPYLAWFDDLCSRAADEDEATALIEAQKIFLQAVSLACHWIQGTPLEPEAPVPDHPLAWGQVFCEELHEIAHYRRERSGNPAEAAPEGPGPGDAPEDQSWGNPLPGLNIQPTLVGLAFSGGGIRSATFNLGVLEALKDLDLLRRMDYLSTVSGGGYIGAWLVGNARRRPAWLGKAADWRESIRYLRRYANYLSPRVGLVSADTWNMWAIWSRNTLLIQVLLFLSIAVVLMVPHGAACVFQSWADAAARTAGVGGGLVLGLPFVLLGISVAGTVGNLCHLKTRWWILPCKQGVTQWLIVVPLLGASLLLAAVLWSQAAALTGTMYSTLLLQTWERWLWPGIVFFILAGCLSWASIQQATPQNLCIAGLTTIISVGAVYAALCGVLLLFVGWHTALGARASWYAFTFGPFLVLTAFTLAIVLLLGLLSRASNEDIREWWSRLGAWLSIYAGVQLILTLAGVFLPLWMAELVEYAGTTWNVTGILGWMATTIAGLLAGKSASTGNNGQQSTSQVAQEWVAQLAPLVFIAGLVAGLASAVHALLLYAFGTWPEAGHYASRYWQQFDTIPGWAVVLCLPGVALVAFLYALRLDINIFSLNSFYRNRLVRCYLGATRDDRDVQAFTGFDEADDLALSDIIYDRTSPTPYTGPFPIVNCALNLGGSSDLALHTRHSASFTLTPLHAGAHRPSVGYAPLVVNGCPHYCGAEGTPQLGQAISVSGAAASPNMGYHTSPVVAFLLTVFNVRLGWWFPNPSKPSKVKKGSPTFSIGPLVRELFGSAGETAGFLNLSDGGHFDNLGIYELVRRRCQVIIAADAECDPNLVFGSLGNVIRICEVDFGAKIAIDVASIRKHPDTGLSVNHCAVGKIYYDDGTTGYLIYMKSSLSTDAETAVLAYKASHPDFPHETTADQFFSDDQFESYRILGRRVAARTFRDIDPSATFLTIAENLYSLWTPKLTGEDKFLGHARALTDLWATLQSDPNGHFLGHELFAGLPASPPPHPEQLIAAFYYYSQVIQLMENVFLDLQLDDTWDHPDNAGWRNLFKRWSDSPTFQSVWTESKMTYGIRFRQFCQRSLGLP